MVVVMVARSSDNNEAMGLGVFILCMRVYHVSSAKVHLRGVEPIDGIARRTATELHLVFMQPRKCVGYRNEQKCTFLFTM